jgi:hypothetical protein
VVGAATSHGFIGNQSDLWLLQPFQVTVLLGTLDLIKLCNEQDGFFRLVGQLTGLLSV